MIQTAYIRKPYPKLEGKGTDFNSFFTANPPRNPAALVMAKEIPKNSPLRSGR
jgi:hypothetical protein